MNASEGDYILAVDGVALTAGANPYSLFDRTAGRQTVLTINDKPELEGAREITVIPVGNEIPLRERNVLLQAAGFTPAYAETSLEEPAMAPIMEALNRDRGVTFDRP